jgi:hypothetical protein
MNQFIKDNWFKLTIAACILVVALSIGYYFFVFVPQREQNIVNRQQEEQVAKKAAAQEAAQKEKTNQSLLNFCLQAAEAGYTADWKANCEDVARINQNYINSCKQLNQKFYNECITGDIGKYDPTWCNRYLDNSSCNTSVDYSANCSLPNARATALNDQLKDAKDECYKRFPIK